MRVSRVEAFKIARHSDLEMTSEYTVVAVERQNRLTRRIQQKLREADSKNSQEKIVDSRIAIGGTPHVSSTLQGPSRPSVVAIEASILAARGRRKVKSPKQPSLSCGNTALDLLSHASTV